MNLHWPFTRKPAPARYSDGTFAPSPKTEQLRTAKQRMTAKLRDELAADKMRAVEVQLSAFRAVEDAICPSLAIQRKRG